MKQLYLILSLFIITTSFAIGQNNNPTTPESDKIYTVVDEAPEFPGGIEALFVFINNEISYPETLKEKNLSGKTIVSFIVMKDGRISEIKIIKSIDSEVDKAVIETIQKMPKWKPGKLKGQKVNVRLSLPVIFNLTNSD